MPEKQLKGLRHQSLWYDASSLVGQPSGMMLQSVAYSSVNNVALHQDLVSDESANYLSQR